MNREKEIVAELQAIEEEKGVVIILAVESGSRAWGFESPDSDWDVRFLYVEKPERYMSVFPFRDVIERPDRGSDGLLDISGWDIRKALWLLHKSNPPLLEWLSSHIVYVKRPSMRWMYDLVPDLYDPRSCIFHYLHMARNNYREYLKGHEVWVKKYLYVLRPCLCMDWIEKWDCQPPMHIDELVYGLRGTLDPALVISIHSLLETKRSGAEMGFGKRISTIDEYLKKGLDREVMKKERKVVNKEKIDKVFREIVGDCV